MSNESMTDGALQKCDFRNLTFYYNAKCSSYFFYYLLKEQVLI